MKNRPDYLDTFNFLKSTINYEDDVIKIDPGTEVRNFTFRSENFKILPGEDSYICSEHNLIFNESDPYSNEVGIMENELDIADSNVNENRVFRYHIFKPVKTVKAKNVVLLFHGFNEKQWFKYLPWAKEICEKTGKTVVLFPIAFHMNRAPSAWSDKRLMFNASNERKKQFPNVINSTLSNVAISMRLHSKPQRFIWSGLQTYYDTIQFIEECRAGKHELIDEDFTIDFFTYSIGSLLAEILMLTNYNGYFSNSKLCMFCGGAVFNRLSPVSKFILDSEANVALYSYLVEHIDRHLKNEKRLRHSLSEMHAEGNNFHCMLDYKVMRTYREKLFQKMSGRIKAFTLEKDTVVPSYEIINTLQGSGRNIPVPVKVFDFPYEYKHENPFPDLVSVRDEVNKSFCDVFGEICDYLK